MKDQKPYRVLLFYKYVTIDNHEDFAAQHLKFCQELGIKGRIYVAHEGINGTLSGTIDQTEAYMNHMKEDPRFADIMWKIDEVSDHAFRKMHVRPKKEIVTWRLRPEDDIDPNEVTGKYLSPKEFFEALQHDDVIVIDGRNDYEYDLGHFQGAIRPSVETTRDFPKWIRENLSQFKDKKVLTYCTGGIRCEKLSGFLVKEGFQDVSQLHGGIATYGKDPEVQGQLWDGKLYVFDSRISVPVNQVEEKVVGKCYHCGVPAETYINCGNGFCNLQHIVCPECEEKYLHSCSDECREHPHNLFVKEMKRKTAEEQEANLLV